MTPKATSPSLRGAAGDYGILAAPRAPRVFRLVARRVVDRRRAQLTAGHRFEDLCGNRKALLAPALGLGAAQHVVREEAKMGGCGDLARQIAGKLQVLGDDVEGAAGGESTAQHRAWNIVEGPAGAGAQRDDAGQDTEVDPGLGADQHTFEGGDEVGVAEILGDELGNATGSR